MTVRIGNEEPTYREDLPVSFFADLSLSDPQIRRAPPGAKERLRRHGEEMRVLGEKREKLAWRELRGTGLEYRVEPNISQGTGGYFAPPVWLNQFFATANRPGRVLSALIPGTFPLPTGVSSINLPIMSTGTLVGPSTPGSAVVDQDVQDSSGSSNLAVLVGESDVSIQLLELSPQGAHIDWAFGKDLAEAYDYQVEQQLLYGPGTANNVAGLLNAANVTSINWTQASPTGPLLWTEMSELFSQVGDSRLMPPEIWLMRTARWGWLLGSEDSTGLPFGLLQPGYLGSDPSLPNPIGGLFGLPVFLSDAIPATVTYGTTIALTGGNQDVALALRPSDMLFLEGAPVFTVYVEVLSGALGARLQLHNSIAAILNRRPAGIGVLGGTGMRVQSSY